MRPASALETIKAAAAIAPNEAIEHLRRNGEVSAEPPYSVDDLRTIANGLICGTSLAELASACALEPGVVVDAVAALGTWLTHTNGPSGVEMVPAGSTEQPSLFSLPPAPLGKKQKNNPVLKGDLSRRVEIPVGFEPADLGRDVRSSLGAVIAGRPSDADLARFHLRTFRSTTKEVSFELISAVAMFARLGRLGDLVDVTQSSAFHRVAVRGFDLLEVARVSALEGVLALADVTVIGIQASPQRLVDACSKARPLFEADMTRLGTIASRLVEADPQRSETVKDLLRREVAYFLAKVQANPTLCPASVAELTDGQILRIAEAAGLDVDPASRSAEGVIRRRLDELGLSADADILVGEAMRAERAGKADTFWESLQTRAAS